MASARKTISVKRIVEIVNERNEKSTCGKEERDGWNSLLEEILMDTEQYEGFTFLTASQVPCTEKPGIHGEDRSDLTAADIANRFKDTDHTRLFYHTNSNRIK